MGRMMRIRIRYILILIIALGWYLSQSGDSDYGERAKAQTMPGPARAMLTDKYARVTIPTPNPEPFSARSAGDIVTLTFRSPVKTDFTAVRDSLKDYVKEITVSEDGKQVTLAFKHSGLRVRKFLSEDSIGIDVLGIHKEPETEQGASTAEPEIEKPQTSEAKSEQTPAPEPVVLASPERITPLVIEEEVEANETAREQAKKNKQEKIAQAALKKKPESKQTSLQKNSNKTAEKIAKPDVATEQPAVASKPTKSPEMPVLGDMPAQKKKTSSDSAQVPDIIPPNFDPSKRVQEQLQKAAAKTRKPVVKNEAVLDFPWREEVASAAFRRGDHVWVVFDKHARVDLSPYMKLANVNKYLEAGEQIYHRYYTILRFRVKPEYVENALHVAFEKQDFTWRLVLFPKSEGVPPETLPRNVMNVQFQVTPKQRLFIPAVNTAEPLRIIDPDIGDELFVVPMYLGGYGVPRPRNYVDVAVLQTAQGLALQKISDGVVFKLIREGVEVTSENQLYTSLDEEQKKKLEEAQQLQKAEEEAEATEALIAVSLFPFRRVNENFEFLSSRDEALKTILEAAPADRNAARLAYAKLLFKEGLYAESLAVLKEIIISNPTFARESKVRPLIAANLLLMGRYEQAVRTFDIIWQEGLPEENLAEMRLWKWAAENWVSDTQLAPLVEAKDFDYAQVLEIYGARYPADLRQRMQLLAMRHKLREHRPDDARRIYEQIQAQKPNEKIADKASYLLGEVYIQKNQHTSATKLWKKLAETATTDSESRAWAVLRLVQVQHAKEEISTKRGIKMLEQARFWWRGDRTEFELLRELGQLYMEQHDYYEGLSTWRTAVNYFPSAREAIDLSAAMTDVFVKLFDEGGAYKLDSVKALALYFDFRELTPIAEEGDRITRKLAEHFVKLDLLENAASVLDHQVRYRTRGDDRVRLAARLVEIYWMDNKFDKAEKLIKDVGQDTDISAGLRANLVDLEAENYLRRGDSFKALKLVEKSDSSRAEDIKLSVFWQSTSWPNIIGLLEPKFTTRFLSGMPLNKREMDQLIKLCIAYSKEKKWVTIAEIKKNYVDLIEDKTVAVAFDFITDQRAPVELTDLEKSLEIGKFQDFLNKLNATANTSAPVLPATKTPETPASPQG